MIEKKAYANIALIKYWGKEENIFPSTSSISLRLKNFVTTTKIEKSNTDIFILNNKIQDINKIEEYIDKFRDDKKCIKITTYNSFPTSAGLSSSSSGFCAMSLALNEYYNNKYTPEELIKISRFGSGSSVRSFYPNVTIWDTKNRVYSIPMPFKLHFFSVVISNKQKEFSSRLAMKSAKESSTLFQKWKNDSKKHFNLAIKYIRTGNLLALSDVMYENFLLMHKTTKYSDLKFSYITKESQKVLDKLLKYRKKLKLLITMDAGSNIKVFCQIKDKDKVHKILKKFGYEILESAIDVDKNWK